MVPPVKALSTKPNNLITYGGRREITLASCPLTSTCTNTHTHTYACIHRTHMHAFTCTNTNTHTAGRIKVLKRSENSLCILKIYIIAFGKDIPDKGL